MSTFQAGQKAELAVSEYLRMNGYKILNRNWKNRYGEIDIVCAKGSEVCFVEVKYRRSADYGSGLEYITKAKAKQMEFAAKMWLSKNGWEGDSRILAIEVGPDYQLGELTEVYY